MSGNFSKTSFNAQEAQNNLNTVFADNTQVNELITSISDLDETKNKYPENPDDYATYIVSEFLSCTSNNQKDQFINLNGRTDLLQNITSETKECLFKFAQDNLNNFQLSPDPHLKMLSGTFYDFGIGVQINPQEAVRFYGLAAEQGHAVAQSNLGCCHASGSGTPINPQEAVRLYELAAEQGYAVAQCNLGICHELGSGTPINQEEAVRLYGLAAKQGNAVAQTNLGNCHKNGSGTPINPQEAVRLYGLAAEQGYATAQSNLGNCHKNGSGTPINPQEAVRLYGLAAEQGNAVAQFNLGYCHQVGLGTPINPQEAVKLYGLAAEQGDTSSQFNLGYCHEKGFGTPINPQEAVRLYGLAAEQGNAVAQSNLGNCHKNGSGTPINPQEAVRLYGLAAKQGNAVAQTNLGNCHKNGSGTPINPQEAVRLYGLAAEQGDTSAQFNLGYCHEKGFGTPINPQEAVRLYGLAAEQGDTSAQCNLGNIYAKGIDVEADYAKAAMFLQLSRKAQGRGNLQKFIRLGWTELMTHSYNGDVKKVTELIEQGLDVNKEFKDERSNKRTALSLAADAEHGETVNELITTVVNLQNRRDESYISMFTGSKYDWETFQNQLVNPKVQNLLNRETTLILASILQSPLPRDTTLENTTSLPEAPLNLKDAIITNFNNANADKPINEEELIQISDIHSLREQEFNHLHESGLSKSKANSQIIQESMLLINPSKQKHFSELSKKIIKLSNNPTLLLHVNTKDVDEVEFDKDDLDILSNPKSFKSDLFLLQLSQSIKDCTQVIPAQAGQPLSLKSLATKQAAHTLMKDVRDACRDQIPNNTTIASEFSNLGLASRTNNNNGSCTIS